MGLIQTQLTDSAILEVQINYLGKVTEYNVSPITTAMLKWLLSPIVKDQVNFVNAPFIASERGIKVIESKTRESEDFASLIMLTVKTSTTNNVLSGTIFGNELPRILRINNFFFEAVPEGHNLLISSADKPGVIGMVTGILGKHNVNISVMQVGEEKEKKENIILLSTNIAADSETIEELRALEHISSVRKIEL